MLSAVICELFSAHFNSWPKNLDLDFVEHQKIFVMSFVVSQYL